MGVLNVNQGRHAPGLWIKPLHFLLKSHLDHQTSENKYIDESGQAPNVHFMSCFCLLYLAVCLFYDHIYTV